MNLNSTCAKFAFLGLIVVFSTLLTKSADRSTFVFDEFITMRAAAANYPPSPEIWTKLSDFKASFKMKDPRPSFAEIKSGLANRDIHPPLYFYIISVVQSFLKNWGFTFFIVNFICLLAISYIATRKRIANKSTAFFLTGVGLLLCCPHIFVSLPAGRQMFLFATFLVAFIFFILDYLNKGNRSIYGVGVATFLMSSTYYASIFYICAFSLVLFLLAGYYWKKENAAASKRCFLLIAAISGGWLIFAATAPEFFQIFKEISQNSLNLSFSDAVQLRTNKLLSDLLHYIDYTTMGYALMELFFYLNILAAVLASLFRVRKHPRESLAVALYFLPLAVYFTSYVFFGPNHGSGDRYFVPPMVCAGCGVLHFWGQFENFKARQVWGLFALIPLVFLIYPTIHYSSQYINDQHLPLKLSSEDLLFSTTFHRGLFGSVTSHIEGDPAIINIQSKSIAELTTLLSAQQRTSVAFYSETPWNYSDTQKKHLELFLEELKKIGYRCESILGSGVSRHSRFGCE